ncbi:hypothetical protein BS47DRAFT_1365454 [Hydnum rufescens UP504]|uniref:Uncharacterized protein n=1 Tax=Hydnum rufescens UP504 TaxID=1448309 RepID=A0A9P6ANS4_9AGAM|nr:hypothetical protein BS47DRAFT_1365454 [Hydnum rufescens UP504]
MPSKNCEPSCLLSLVFAASIWISCWPLVAINTSPFPGSGLVPWDSSRESNSEQSQCLALCLAPPPEASAKGGVIILPSPSPTSAPHLLTSLCPSTTTSALLNPGGTSLHWFPLADKVVEPTLSLPSTSSPVYSMRKWRPSQARSSSLSFSTPSQETVLYHPSTHKCIFIPPHLCSPHQFLEILRHLDQPRDEYPPFSSGPPLMTYQFLVTWACPMPRECPSSSYFLFDEDLGGWYMDRRWMVAVQLALEKLQAVIRDTLALVGADAPGFLIDHNLELSEKLWRAKDLRELRTADKLLKLRVQLVFARLEKLERLHKGLSWASPLAPKSSFFLPLEFCGSLPEAEGVPALEPLPRSRLCPLILVQHQEKDFASKGFRSLLKPSEAFEAFRSKVDFPDEGGKQLGTTPSGGIPKPPGPAGRLPGPPTPSASLPSPSPPHPQSFGNLHILPHHHSSLNTLDGGFPMTPTTSELDEYCRPSGHALLIPFQYSLSLSPCWKWPPIALGMCPEWAPALSDPKKGLCWTIWQELPAWKPHFQDNWLEISGELVILLGFPAPPPHPLVHWHKLLPSFILSLVHKPKYLGQTFGKLVSRPGLHDSGIKSGNFRRLLLQPGQSLDHMIPESNLATSEGYCNDQARVWSHDSGIKSGNFQRLL